MEVLMLSGLFYFLLMKDGKSEFVFRSFLLHFRTMVMSIKFWNLPVIFYRKSTDSNDQKNSENLNKGIGKCRKFRHQ